MRKGCLCLAGLIVVACPYFASAQKSGAGSDAGRTVVSLPDKSWGIQMNLPGFQVKSNGLQQDGRAYLLAENDGTGVTVSATLEHGAGAQSSTGCKEDMQARIADTPQNRALGFGDKSNVKIWQAEDRWFLEYLIPTTKAAGGMTVPIHQQNRFTCFVHEDVFVDVHVSKVDFHPADAKLIDAVFDSIQIQEGTAQPGLSSLDYFKAGSAKFIANDYKGAILPYTQALALEQKRRQLEKNYWYVLVDNLGMAYGITGDLESARRKFEYGIQTDPDYPLFYYEMADYYGEKADAQNAIAYLKKAYQRKKNAIPGEGIPDPRQDDSFKQLLNNKDFRDAVDQLTKPS